MQLMNSFSFGVNGKERMKEPETKIHLVPIQNAQERNKFLKKLEISSHFNMRYRGLFEFYGNDLIEYKQKNFSSNDCNTFLRIFSSYITDYLEDKMPPSWKKCKPSFLEKLIYLYLPYSLKITSEKKEMVLFLNELTTFSIWLDQRENTSWTALMDKYQDSIKELNECEQLLNHLFLTTFPHYLQSNWNYKADLEKILLEQLACDSVVNNIFQVTHIIQDITVLTDIHSNKIYNVINLPIDLISPGILLHATLGIKKENLYWNLVFIEGVYPQKAKRYFVFRS
jgi:hypothetical protein